MINNKVAIITGAGRGIGQGIAKKLAADGFAIAIFDMLDPEAIAENLDQVKALGTPVLYFRGDLTKAADRTAFADKVVAEFGRIDVLVNNAGVAPRVRMDMLETTEESYDFVLNINLKGTFFFTQTIANKMIECKTQAGRIINIASMSSYTSSVARAEYCISKAGISMLTTLFADRLAEHDINVYEVRPGIIKTDMTATVTEKYDRLIFEEGILPIKKWGFPEDIAKAVAAFANDYLPYSTGEVINVDGGYHIRRL